jgi:hypothetical protein
VSLVVTLPVHSIDPFIAGWCVLARLFSHAKSLRGSSRLTQVHRLLYLAKKLPDSTIFLEAGFGK